MQIPKTICDLYPTLVNGNTHYTLYIYTLWTTVKIFSTVDLNSAMRKRWHHFVTQNHVGFHIRYPRRGLTPLKWGLSASKTAGENTTTKLKSGVEYRGYNLFRFSAADSTMDISGEKFRGAMIPLQTTLGEASCICIIVYVILCPSNLASAV